MASGPTEAFDAGAAVPDRDGDRSPSTPDDDEQSRLVKLCHNLYLGIMVQALVEVITLAEKGGTDRAAFLDFLNGTVIGSEWVRRRTPDLVGRDWTPTFTTELLRKDFDLGAAALPGALEVPMPVAAAVHQLIQSAVGTRRTATRTSSRCTSSRPQAPGSSMLRCPTRQKRSES